MSEKAKGVVAYLVVIVWAVFMLAIMNIPCFLKVN